jgi:hypothetical protein
MAPDRMPIQRFGQCVCGAVRYVCSGEPERVTICHCLWCQRRTGTRREWGERTPAVEVYEKHFRPATEN